MPMSESFEQLLERADQSVQNTLRFFEGPGASSKVRIDRWGVWEVAVHMLFWHRATAEASRAVARGRPPLQHTKVVDALNEEAVAKAAGTTLAGIVAQLKEAHRELLQAMRDLPDPDAVLMRRADGSTPTGKDRLRTIDRHWTGHLDQLKAAASS